MVDLENDKMVIKQLLCLLNEQKEQVKGYEVGEISIANELLMANRLKNYLDEIEIYKKALELASEQIWAMSVWENTKNEVVEDNVNFFVNKAKEYIGE